MYSSPQSANVASPTVCNFDELENLRLESERFSADLNRLKSQFRSHTYLHSLVSRIAQKFTQLTDNWNEHCETAIDKVQIERQKAVEQMHALSGKSELSLSSSRRRVNLLELQEHEMEVKEKVLHTTLKNLTSLLRSDLEFVEQAIEGQKLMRNMQDYDHKEMLHQVDGEVGRILGMEQKEERIAELPRQLVPHPPVQRPKTGIRPTHLRPKIEVIQSDSDEELNVTEEFDKVMDELRLQQAQRPEIDLNMSMEKSVGGWDSAFDSEASSPDASLSPNKLKSALLILRKVHLLNNVSLTQNPDLIRQIEEVLNGPNVTQNLEPPSDLACTTPKSFQPSEKVFDRTVLSTGRHLFAKEATNHADKASDSSIGKISSEDDNQEMQWEDFMGDNETEGKPHQAETKGKPDPPRPTPINKQKTDDERLKEGSNGLGNLSSPRTLRFAQTYLSQQSRELGVKLSPAPLLDHEQSKFMYQLTKRSSTFSTKASSGLKSRMLKGSGDMVLESPCYQPTTKAFDRVMDSS